MFYQSGFSQVFIQRCTSAISCIYQGDLITKIFETNQYFLKSTPSIPTVIRLHNSPDNILLVNETTSYRRKHLALSANSKSDELTIHVERSNSISISAAQYTSIKPNKHLTFLALPYAVIICRFTEESSKEWQKPETPSNAVLFHVLSMYVTYFLLLLPLDFHPLNFLYLFHSNIANYAYLSALFESNKR